MTRRLSPLIALACLLVIGCIARDPAPAPSGPPTASRTPAPTFSPVKATPVVPSAAATAALLTGDDLPELRPDAVTVLAVCSPSPGLAFEYGGQDLLGCSDGVELGLRAIQTVTEEPFGRVWLLRPACAAPPCSAEQLATGTVTAWSGDRAWTTDVDARTGTATPPTVDGDPRWPSLDAVAPSVKRPMVAGAPAEVRARIPLPFCGSAEIGEPPAVMRCFLAAVLAGRPAEIVETFYGTEGGTITVVSRFTGSGAIVTYRNSVDAQAQSLPWYRQLNRLSLGVAPEHWSNEPIYGTDRALP